jgi:hypothetical protein
VILDAERSTLLGVADCAANSGDRRPAAEFLDLTPQRVQQVLVAEQ